MSSGSTKGYLAVVSAAVLWGSNSTVGKTLLKEGITLFDLAQVRVTLGAALLAFILLIWNKRLFRIRKKDILYFLILGGLVFSLVNLSYFYAVSKIPVAAALLLEYLCPVLIYFYSMLFWKERLNLVKSLSLALAFGGCYLAVGAYDLRLLEMHLPGIMGGLAAAVSFGAYTLLVERGMHRHPPWTVLFYALAFSAVTMNLVHTPGHFLKAGFTLWQWIGLTYVVIAGTILPFGLYLTGINYIRATRASITATLEPIAAGVVAYFVLGEVLGPLQLIGGALVIAAVVILQLQREVVDLAPALIRSRSD